MTKSLLFSMTITAIILGGNGLIRADDSPIVVPEVSDVTIEQVNFTRKVVVTYKLTGAPAIITLAIETNGVAIPDKKVTTLSGDIYTVVKPDEGTKSIIWQAGDDCPENTTDQAVAKVTAWSLDAPPEIMLVDLRKGTDASALDQYPVLF